jgi:GNAT superfamily N-acetyltransferase
MVHVRPYRSTDRPFIFSLGPRLAIGMPPWRDQQLWLTAVEGWLAGSLDPHNESTAVFIAESDQGERLGFATVSPDTHFTGQRQAYIGELATLETAESQGVGTMLVQACEEWARSQGYPILALTTGARNTRALGFYRHLGFEDEDVKLIKQL